MFNFKSYHLTTNHTHYIKTISADPTLYVILSFNPVKVSSFKPYCFDITAFRQMKTKLKIIYVAGPNENLTALFIMKFFTKNDM